MAGLALCAWVFSSCGNWGLLSDAGGCVGFSLRGLLLLQSMSSGVQASVVSAQGSVASWRVGCSQTKIKPVSPARVHRFLTTGPSGKSRIILLAYIFKLEDLSKIFDTHLFVSNCLTRE